jgi:hypothetical protein
MYSMFTQVHAMSENNSPTKLGAGAGTIAANPLFQPPSDGDADPHLGVAVAGAVAVAPAAKAKANSAAAAFQRLSDRQQQGSSPFTVEYDAGPVGLGFKSASMEGKIVPGIIVKNVVSDGPSDRWGLIEIGDRVVRVNETDLSDKVMSTCDKACATAAIRAAMAGPFTLTFIRSAGGQSGGGLEEEEEGAGEGDGVESKTSGGGEGGGGEEEEEDQVRSQRGWSYGRTQSEETGSGQRGTSGGGGGGGEVKRKQPGEEGRAAAGAVLPPPKTRPYEAALGLKLGYTSPKTRANVKVGNSSSVHVATESKRTGWSYGKSATTRAAKGNMLGGAGENAQVVTSKSKQGWAYGPPRAPVTIFQQDKGGRGEQGEEGEQGKQQHADEAVEGKE